MSDLQTLFEPLPGKGETRCNRMACQVELGDHRWWNRSTRAYYCRACALRINEVNPMLCIPELART